MKRHNLVSVLTIVLTATLAGASLAADEDAPQWQSLFDGKDLDGWQQHGGKARYTVEDGVIVGQSVPN
ncbi:MAG: DUF1080 domain-containing protein, partial [Candidatus Nealsonbacteria bacterium]|nr:DUF1080 domain-containing protein [Candidatus Nealsonbacteria bacterium]